MIKQKAAKANNAVKIVSAIVLAMAIGLVVASFYKIQFLIGALLLGIISLICYLLAPVSYELSEDKLTVFSRLSKRTISPIQSCKRITDPVKLTLRLWGNGGLFAVTGIYWNKAYGKFRAYLTSTKTEDVVLIETDKLKIVISPENVDELISKRRQTDA